MERPTAGRSQRANLLQRLAALQMRHLQLLALRCSGLQRQVEISKSAPPSLQEDSLVELDRLQLLLRRERAEHRREVQGLKADITAEELQLHAACNKMANIK